MFTNGINTRAVLYAFLIHYTADIAQPLHTSTRVTRDFPTGDRGGNEFLLKSHYSVDELHALYDTVLYEFTRPVDIKAVSDNLTAIYR